MSGKQSFKRGEKVLFGIFGAFLIFSVVAYAALEMVRANRAKPLYQVTTHFTLSKEGGRGAILFRHERCTSCHRAMRNGTNMGLNLDGIGSRRSPDWIYNFLRNPEQTYGAVTLDHGTPPKEAAYVMKMPEQDLRAIAVFLSELRAESGSPVASAPPPGDSSFIDTMVEMWTPDAWKEKYEDVRTKQPPAPPAGGEH